MSFIPPTGSYAVIFTSQRTDGEAGYGAMADHMAELAAQQPGYLGVRSARGADGLGITVSYWDSLASIAAWRANLAHQAARNQGRQHWYTHYELQVVQVSRAYAWQSSSGSADDPAAP